MYILDFGNIVFSDENIKDKLEYIHTINPDGDLLLGIAAMAELKFTLYDLSASISDADIVGREFTFKKSKTSESISRWNVFKTIKPTMMCMNGDTIYSVKNKVFSINSVPVKVPPTEPIHCIYIVGDTVYLGHTNTVSAYTLAGQKQADIPLTDFQKTQIVSGRCLNMQGDTLKEYSVRLFNQRPADFVEKTSVFTQVGIFNALKSERRNSTNIVITGYDRMSKFNVVIDSLLNTINYPITAYSLLVKVCALCGVKLIETEITNGDFPIDSNSTYTNTTGRNALKWIGELSNNFSYIDHMGQLHMRFYQASPIEYTANNFKSVRRAEYVVAKVDNLQIKVEESDAGVCVGTGTNLYLILNNPFFYVTREETLRPYAQVLYDKIKDFDYTPCEFETVLDNDFEADVGNIVLVKGAKTVIMSKRIKGLIETYSSSGNIDRRIKEDNLNFIVQRNILKTNEVSNKTDEVINDFDSVFEYKEEEDKFYLKESVDMSHASQRWEAVEDYPVAMENGVLYLKYEV